MHKKSHLYHTVLSFLVVLFSYVSLSLHVHFPSNTGESQGNRVEQVPSNCTIAAWAPVSLNNSPAQGLQPTTFSGVSAVVVNSQALLQTPHQAGHTTFPLLISDLLRVHLPSYLGNQSTIFPSLTPPAREEIHSHDDLHIPKPSDISSPASAKI